jgi:rRNA maturation endonuclease Nob1
VITLMVREHVMLRYRCTNPACIFEGEIHDAIPEVARCPVCGGMAIVPSYDKPHYRCRLCGSVVQFDRDVGLSASCGAGLPFDSCPGTADRLVF